MRVDVPRKQGAGEISRLAVLRFGAGLSQAQLGRAVGITSSAVSLAELGRLKLSSETRARVVEVLASAAELPLAESFLFEEDGYAR